MRVSFSDLLLAALTHLQAGVQLASLTTLLASLTRPSNLFLFVLLWGQYFVLRQVRMALSPLLFSSTVIALQHVSFFAFGGSNSLATYVALLPCPSLRSNSLTRAQE